MAHSVLWRAMGIPVAFVIGILQQAAENNICFIARRSVVEYIEHALAENAPHHRRADYPVHFIMGMLKSQSKISKLRKNCLYNNGLPFIVTETIKQHTEAT